MTFTNALCILVAGLCLAATAQPSAAQAYHLTRGFSFDPTESVIYTKVPYADLDLASTTGAEALMARIEGAADAVCRRDARPSSRRTRDANADCRERAVAVAVAKMRSPILTELASRRQQTGRAAR